MGELVTDLFPNPMSEPPGKPSPPLEAKARLIGLRLRAVREALGLRPVDVCRALGVAQNLYSTWESGKGRFSLDGAIAFCDRYGVGMDWIYLGDKHAIHRDRNVADTTIRIYEVLKANPSAA